MNMSAPTVSLWFLLLLPGSRSYSVSPPAGLFHNLLLFERPFNHPNDLRPPTASLYKHLALSDPSVSQGYLMQSAKRAGDPMVFANTNTRHANLTIHNSPCVFCFVTLLFPVFAQVQILTSANSWLFFLLLFCCYCLFLLVLSFGKKNQTIQDLLCSNAPFSLEQFRHFKNKFCIICSGFWLCCTFGLHLCSVLLDQAKIYAWVWNWGASLTAEVILEICGVEQLSPLSKQQTTSACQHLNLWLLCVGVNVCMCV